MKRIYEFTLPRTEEKKVETTEEKDGEKVTIEKTVKETTNQKVFLKKPTRSMHDDAELYYGVRLSEGIKAGLLTRALLARRFSNDGGVLSEKDKEDYAELYLELAEVQTDLERKALIPEKAKTKSEKEEVKNLFRKAGLLRQRLTEFELTQASLFDQTAENRARNKTVMWWVLFLSHFEDEEGNVETVFGDGDFDSRIEKYDEYEQDPENEDFYDVLLKRLVYYISFWYVGRAQTQEDFDSLLEEVDSMEQEEAEESVSTEEAKPAKKKRKKRKKANKTEKVAEEVAAEVVEETIEEENREKAVAEKE